MNKMFAKLCGTSKIIFGTSYRVTAQQVGDIKFAKGIAYLVIVLVNVKRRDINSDEVTAVCMKEILYSAPRPYEIASLLIASDYPVHRYPYECSLAVAGFYLQ